MASVTDETQTPNPEHLPIPLKQLERISKGLHARLEEETTLAFPSVQYIFSEVGRTFNRIDPRELRVGLHLLANNPRPDASLP
jgi:hypothetical protein